MPISIIQYIVTLIIGVIVGSFLNVCIYRLPSEQSIVTNSSHCMKCGAKIKRYDLIPVISWFILRGRCRACHEKFSIRYPMIELLNGLLWILSIWRFDMTIKGILVCFLFSALIVVFFMDWDTQLINTGVCVVIGLLGVANMFITKDLKITNYLIGAAIVSVPLLLISVISKEQAMGMGDAYLMAAGGLFLGIKPVTVAIFIGLILGSIVGLILKYITKSSRFAFGPYLSIGIAVAALYGDEIFDAYLKLVGFA